MEKKKEEYYSLKDLLGIIRSYFYYLGKKWYLLLLAIAIGAGIGVGYYYFQKPKYEAISTFILEEKSIGGGLSGLASQFGFDLGSLTGGNSNLFSGDNILEILKSKNIIRKVLLSKIDSSKNKTLADEYLLFSGYRDKWENKPLLNHVSFENVQEMSSIQDSVLNIIYNKLLRKSISAERVNKKGTSIEVRVVSKNREFARLLSIRMVQEAKNLYLDIKTSTAQANINRLQKKADSLLAILNGKSYVAASSQLLDVNPGMRAAAVPAEIASRDKTVVATLYGEVAKNLEASKMIFAQQAPVIQDIDYPTISLPDNKVEMQVSVLVFSAIGFLMTSALLILMKVIYQKS